MIEVSTLWDFIADVIGRWVKVLSDSWTLWKSFFFFDHSAWGRCRGVGKRMKALTTCPVHV